jgi:hypothetical protein
LPPVIELVHAVAQKWLQLDDIFIFAKSRLTVVPNIRCVLGYDVGTLPIIFAIEQQQNPTALNVTEGLWRIPHIRFIGRAKIGHFESGAAAR